MIGVAKSAPPRPSTRTPGPGWPWNHGLLVLALALLLVHAGMAITNSRHSLEESARAQRAGEGLRTLERVTLQLAEAESAQRGFLLTGDPAFLPPIRKYEDEQADALRRLRAEVVGDPDGEARVERLAELLDRRKADLAKTLALHEAEGLGAAISWIDQASSREAMAQVHAEEDELAEILEARHIRAEAEVKRRVRTADRALLASTATVALALGAWWGLVRRVELRRQRVLDALRTSEARLRTITDNLPIALFATDVRGVVVYAEGSGLSRIAPEDGTLIGRNLQDPAVLGEDVSQHVRRALGGEAHSTRLPEKEHVFQVWFAPHRNREGALAGVLGMAVDVTEQVRAERELRELTTELERRVTARTTQYEAANRELESFGYSVSHDLRAPLRAIDGFSSALAEECGASLSPPCATYLERVRGAAKRMGHLIDDLLQLSHVGQTDIVREDVDLSAIAGTILDELAQRFPDRRVDIRIQPDVVARGDPRLLRIVLENLLDNAWKFTARTTDARVSFLATDEQGRRVYRVEDNGAGFDMAYAGRLFAPFQRLHAPTEFEGTGIGLATVRRIVTRHGGVVWAEAEPGKGARISFTLEP